MLIHFCSEDRAETRKNPKTKKKFSLVDAYLHIFPSATLANSHTEHVPHSLPCLNGNWNDTVPKDCSCGCCTVVLLLKTPLNVRHKVVSFYACHNPQKEEAKSWYSIVNQNKFMPTISGLKSSIFPASWTLRKACRLLSK